MSDRQLTSRRELRQFKTVKESADLFKALLLTLSLAALVLSAPTLAAAPLKGTPENPYRLAIVSSQNLWAYERLENLLIEAINNLGWEDRLVMPPELKSTWDNYGVDDYPKLAQQLLERNDYDLILSFGTVTTKTLLAQNTQGRNILGLGISNPVTAGIVKQEAFSGIPNFTTVVFPYSPGQSMFIIFHNMLKFKKLGILYTDSEVGRANAFLPEARDVARERGFQLVEYSQVDRKETYESCLDGLNYLLAQEIDSLYLPSLTCFNSRSNDLKEFYQLIYDHNVIPMTSEDREQIRNYAMVGFSFDESRSSVAEFHVNQIIEILNGKSPGEVNMITEFNTEFLLNLAAAEKLGIDLDLEFLRASDCLYLELYGLN
jgi:ABC-type uncharacterized transport system substrate-binding protein